jgi:uncharacterized membrane protein HdeD (DUF308 family)
VAVQISHLWWVPLISGLISIGLGLAILANDWTVHALVVVTGFVLVVRGLALAFNPTYAADSHGEQIVAGVLGAIAGIVLIAWPGPTLLVLAVVVGAWLTVSGGFHIVSCISRRKTMAHWVFGLAVGVIELLLGVWAIRRPDITLNLLITIIGLWVVLTGVIYCALAFEIRGAARTMLDDSAPTTPGAVNL